MVCPYRKMTETVDGTTREYFMDCYGTECPYYRAEQHFGNCYIEAYCEKTVNKR